MNKSTIFGVCFSILASIFVFFTTSAKVLTPREAYRVYLDGKSLGLIENNELLEEYINQKEDELKEKYDVNDIYIPNNIDIVKEVTYNTELSTVEDIYNHIKKIAPFTINGYKIIIKGTEEKKAGQEKTEVTPDVYVYVLDQQVFIDATTDVINAFVKDNGYSTFINDKQEELVDIGTLIEDVYIQNEIVIKKTNISVEGTIFTTAESLKKYLLFGTTENQDTYVIRDGDTIEDVSYNHKLSVEEFLIANPQFTNANNLLYKGQQVTVGIINPIIKVVEEDHTVTLEEHKYDIVYEEDPDLIVGYDYVKQEGINGTDKVVRKIKKVNGEIISANTNTSASEEIKPAITKVIVRGQKHVSGVGNPKVWAWPTNIPYMISTKYEWRWGEFHEGIDIYGTGFASPIYAANNGVIFKASYDPISGNFIIINHNNGYYTVYGHMSSLLVKEGQTVEMGQRIGLMGETGYSFGVHLHFGVYMDGPPFYSSTAYSINPLGLY